MIASPKEVNMSIIEVTYLKSGYDWQKVKTKRINFRHAKGTIRATNARRTSEGWEFNDGPYERVVITIEPNEDRICDWGQRHGYSRTH